MTSLYVGVIYLFGARDREFEAVYTFRVRFHVRFVWLKPRFTVKKRTSNQLKMQQLIVFVFLFQRQNSRSARLNPIHAMVGVHLYT
jgi:hypothetical protein